MLNRITILVTILILHTTVDASPPFSLKHKSPSGYMGLFDWGVSLGTINKSEYRQLINDLHEEIKTTGPYFMAHFQEGMLSNYFWSLKNQDKRFKFGVVEILELGVNYTTTKTSDNDSFSPVTEPSKKMEAMITYEGGLGAVYKVNNSFDIGMNYYFLSTSSYNDKEKNPVKYLKIRSRYKHLMMEYSCLGRKAVDIKYMRNGVEDRSYTSYIGLSWSGWKTVSTIGQYTHKANYFYFTVGGVF